jgi:hypothetical protein
MTKVLEGEDRRSGLLAKVRCSASVMENQQADISVRWSSNNEDCQSRTLNFSVLCLHPPDSDPASLCGKTYYYSMLSAVAGDSLTTLHKKTERQTKAKDKTSAKLPSSHVTSIT